MHIPCADFDYYPLAALGYSLCVPTWPSICALQNVSALAQQLSFHVLTSPSLCCVQLVSTPQSVGLFLSVS
jgi:hypothetical protein